MPPDVSRHCRSAAAVVIVAATVIAAAAVIVIAAATAAEDENQNDNPAAATVKASVHKSYLLWFVDLEGFAPSIVQYMTSLKLCYRRT